MTLLTTSTVLVPDCLRICSSTVGSPLTLASGLRLGHAVFDAGDVAHLHRVAADLAQHDVAELVGRFDAAARAQRHRLRALIDAAAGHVGVLRLQRARHVVDGQVLGAQPLGVEHRR